jgi:hypothetical protein
MTIRAVEIPAVQKITGDDSQAYIEISLRDAYGRVGAFFSETDDDIVGGIARIVAGDADQTINLTTTDTITETVTYTIKVQGNQFYQIFRNRPLTDGVGTLDWESFIGVG